MPNTQRIIRPAKRFGEAISRVFSPSHSTPPLSKESAHDEQEHCDGIAYERSKQAILILLPANPVTKPKVDYEQYDPDNLRPANGLVKTTTNENNRLNDFRHQSNAKRAVLLLLARKSGTKTDS